MSSEEVALDCLAERLSKLHTAVFSKKSAIGHDEPIEILKRTLVTLKELESKRSVLSQLWKKLPQLDEFLSTEFMQKIGLNDEVKTRLILANEENVKAISKHMNDLKCFQSVVHHPALNDTMKMAESLKPVVQMQINQREELNELEGRIASLLSAYEGIVTTLSKQITIWNSLVTQCELALDMRRDAIE